MSHFTVLVVDNDPDAALAPFDENIEVGAYRDYQESEAEDFWLTETLRKEGKLTVAKPTWADVVAANNSHYVDEPYSQLYLDDDGRAYALSTYNPERWGLVWMHGKGREADQSARDEVLFEVQADQASRGIPTGAASARWSVHVLLPLHTREERGADPDVAATLAHPADLRNQHGGVQSNRAATVGPVRDLRTDTGAILDGGGSLPFNADDPGLALSDLQHGTRLAPGFTVRAPSRAALPVPPSGWKWALVAGSKWDWYQIGGRWAGHFLLKPGHTGLPVELGGWEWKDVSDEEKAQIQNGRSDQALKGDIDIVGMRDQAQAAAEVAWHRWHEFVADTPEATPWSAFVEDVQAGRLGIEEARTRYHQQARVAKLQEAKELPYWSDPIEDMQTSKQSYALRNRLAAVPGFACVIKRQWLAPGRMGWFGNSSDSPTERIGYWENVNGLIDEAADDMLFTNIDAHI